MHLSNSISLSCRAMLCLASLCLAFLCAMQKAKDATLSAFPNGTNMLNWTGTIVGPKDTVCCAPSHV